jgi:hypothetical protein
MQFLKTMFCVGKQAKKVFLMITVNSYLENQKQFVRFNLSLRLLRKNYKSDMSKR